MNVSAIGPTSATKAAAVGNSPVKKASPTRPAPIAGAVLATLAATVTLTAVPASVKPDERVLYMQILKSVGGNAAVALAMLHARESSQGGD